jgi:YHS domain-containing protein
MTVDIVCGLVIDENQTQYYSEYKGERFVFCSEGCKMAFDEKPEVFVEQLEYGCGCGSGCGCH